MRTVTRGGAVLVLVTFLLALTGVAGASPRDTGRAARSAAARHEAREDAAERVAARRDAENRHDDDRDAASDRRGDHEADATPTAEEPPTGTEVTPPPPPAIAPPPPPAVAPPPPPTVAPATPGVAPPATLGAALAAAPGVAPTAVLMSDLAVTADLALSLPGAPADHRPEPPRVLQPASATPHRGWANRAAAQAPWDLSLGALGPLSSALGVEPLRAGVHNAAPIGLGGLVLVFLLVQAQIDKRDPKLTRAPMRRDDDGMCFT